MVPELILNLVFVALSVVHFADDIGQVGSAAFHAAVGATSMIVSREAGIDIVLVYMCVLHVPLHFVLLNDSREYVAIVVALVFMIVLGIVAISWPVVYLVVPEEEMVSVSPLVQTIVCAHILFGRNVPQAQARDSQPQKKAVTKQ